VLTIEIPGGPTLALEHLVLDYNGTLAEDGVLLPGVEERIRALAPRLTVHVVTADTFGTAREAMAGLPCEVAVLAPGRQDERKREFVDSLGAAGVAAVGNGRNDARMLEAAALGICVVAEEGAAHDAAAASDVIVTSIASALDLLLKPKRLVATLRL
jgi:P-type E1-E2 ATPase